MTPRAIPAILFTAAALCALAAYETRADVLARAEKALLEATTAKNAAARCEYSAGEGAKEAAGTPDSADMVKAQSECRLLKNDAQRAAYALDKVIARHKAPEPPPPPPPPEPDPAPPEEPDPVPPSPPVPPPDGITVDGGAVVATSLGSITTPTGSWPVQSLGAVTEGKAYLFRLASKPDWGSICIVRAPDGDGSIDERAYSVASPYYTGTIRVLPGSMKCADNGEPIAPDMGRVVAAVQAGRVVPYSAQAFVGWPKSPALVAERPSLNRKGYNPARIYARSSGSAPNAIAAPLAGSGGEYGTSRGFISASDAVTIAAALDGKETVFKDSAAGNRIEVLYGMSIPHLIIWSMHHDQLRDPQVPLPGEAPYYNEGTKGERYGNEGTWCAPADYPYLAEIEATAGTCYAHTRDEAHLFNHGYAYWLATGDPRAAILLQATNAYMLAANYQRTAGKYRPRFAYQRATVNQFNALWVLRDVRLNASGPLLWDAARTEKMEADMWNGWQAMLASMDAETDVYSRSSTAVRGVDRNSDNAYNAYQIHGYGIEAAALWAKAGRPALLRRIGEHLIVRFGIGGTRGYYGCGGGSGFAVLKDGTMPYDGTSKGLADWTNTCSPYPADSFNGTPVHYAQRAYWGLRFTAALVPDANVDGVTAAMILERFDAARAATTKWEDVNQLRWKHGALAQ